MSNPPEQKENGRTFVSRAECQVVMDALRSTNGEMNKTLEKLEGRLGKVEAGTIGLTLDIGGVQNDVTWIRDRIQKHNQLESRISNLEGINTGENKNGNRRLAKLEGEIESQDKRKDRKTKLSTTWIIAIAGLTGAVFTGLIQILLKILGIV